MSTYEPGRLYLIDLDGETHEARYFANGISPPHFQLGEGRFTHRDNAANARPAIVLDPENQNVKGLLRQNETDWDEAADAVIEQIRAQVSPPEPAMEEPTEWCAQVTDDRGDWSRAEGEAPGDTLRWAPRDWTKADWSTWDQMENPRPYEKP